jgi:hypothetical protein
MSYISQEKMLENEDFQIKVRQAMTKAALDIVGETLSPTGEYNTKRHDLGTGILRNLSAYEIPFRRAIASLGTIEPTGADADYEWAVSSVFNDIAGVSGV